MVARKVLAAALWAGGLAPSLPAAVIAEETLAITSVCRYGQLGGAAVVGGNAPIRCEPPVVLRGADPLPSLHPAPASIPVGVVPQEVAPAPGFEPVWDDGRINPGRGVPTAVAGPVVLGTRAVGSASVP
jgi:hypothetical protein